MENQNNNDKIKVYVRIKPIENSDPKNNNICKINYNIIQNQILIKQELDNKRFYFDKCFDDLTTQEEVFNETSKPIVNSLFEGYNGSIMTYGQTGSGKTHTILGNYLDKRSKGLLPRTLEYIFYIINNNKTINNNIEYNVNISYMQIYLENLQDLINPNNDKIKIKEEITSYKIDSILHKKKTSIVENNTFISVSNINDALDILFEAEKNRISAKTLMNAHSSRSHAIFMIKLEQNNKQDNFSKISYMYIADLAGSERVNKTGVENIRLEEAKKINYSLLVLSKCIQELSKLENLNANNFFSYKDSKLTRLLKDALGGNSKTSIILTVSQLENNLDETVSTMLFGQKAMKVLLKPVINNYKKENESKFEDMYNNLKKEFDLLEDKTNNISFLKEKLIELLDKSDNYAHNIISNIDNYYKLRETCNDFINSDVHNSLNSSNSNVYISKKVKKTNKSNKNNSISNTNCIKYNNESKISECNKNSKFGTDANLINIQNHKDNLIIPTVVNLSSNYSIDKKNYSDKYDNKAVNTDNLSYSKQLDSILRDLFGNINNIEDYQYTQSSNSNANYNNFTNNEYQWSLPQIEEVLTCLNDENLSLNNTINKLKNELTDKKFEITKLKDKHQNELKLLNIKKDQEAESIKEQNILLSNELKDLNEKIEFYNLYKNEDVKLFFFNLNKKVKFYESYFSIINDYVKFNSIFVNDIFEFLNSQKMHSEKLEHNHTINDINTIIDNIISNSKMNSIIYTPRIYYSNVKSYSDIKNTYKSLIEKIKESKLNNNNKKIESNNIDDAENIYSFNTCVEFKKLDDLINILDINNIKYIDSISFLVNFLLYFKHIKKSDTYNSEYIQVELGSDRYKQILNNFNKNNYKDNLNKNNEYYYNKNYKLCLFFMLSIRDIIIKYFNNDIKYNSLSFCLPNNIIYSFNLNFEDTINEMLFNVNDIRNKNSRECFNNIKTYIENLIDLIYYLNNNINNVIDDKKIQIVDLNKKLISLLIENKSNSNDVYNLNKYKNIFDNTIKEINENKFTLPNLQNKNTYITTSTTINTNTTNDNNKSANNLLANYSFNDKYKRYLFFNKKELNDVCDILDEI